MPAPNKSYYPCDRCGELFNIKQLRYKSGGKTYTTTALVCIKCGQYHYHRYDAWVSKYSSRYARYDYPAKEEFRNYLKQLSQ